MDEGEWRARLYYCEHQPVEQVRISVLEADQIGHLMAGLSIEEERAAPKRYIAKLSIRFLANKTRKLFGRYNARYAEKQSDPVLVVPVWVTKEGADIWNGENSFRTCHGVRTIDTTGPISFTQTTDILHPVNLDLTKF